MRVLILIGLFTLLVSKGQAQSKIHILDRKISIRVEKEPLNGVLKRIEQEGEFSFSYNASAIHDDQVIILDAENKSVREILNEIFKGTMDYKERGSHLILLKLPVQQSPNTSMIISGYVQDAMTQQKIANASVYDKKSITSVITDEFGYFRMRLEKKDQAASIAVSKKAYRDTLVMITAPGNQYITISIMPIVKDTVHIPVVPFATDSLPKVKKEELSMPYLDEPNIRNISDTLHRDIQISFLPFVGSNGRLSGNVINDYSINILGGYSLGTRQIELGFFLNMDRGDVSWFQVAGLGNIVGGNVYGFQGSGFFNLNGSETKAAQLTGFANINFDDFQGVQMAGFTNINLESAQGVQVAGFGNFNRGRSQGVQIAGFSNVQTDRYEGSQIAAGGNIATEHLTGSQISALFNYGKNVHGTQIGLFNFSDSLGGVPIGLVSYVNSGYHKLEISADEIFHANIAFRTGARKFYNILLAGIKPERVNDTNVWTFGYGVGFAPRLSRTLQLNVDLTSQHVNKGSFTTELSLLNKVNVGVDFQLTRKFSVYGGVAMNGYLTKTSYTDYPAMFTDFNPHIVYDRTFDNNTNLKVWWGAKVGLRFF